MLVPKTLLSAMVCASALVPFGAAHAVDVISYVGYTSADNFDSFNRLQDVDRGTTTTPASYGVSVDGNLATSTTDAANGGSVYAYSRSAGAYSTQGGFTNGGGAGASTTITYQVTLVGPASAVVVPVHVVSHGYVKGAGSTQASATFVVNYDSGGASAQLLASTSLDAVNGNSFSFDEVVKFKVNAAFEVYLSVSSGSGGPGSPAGWSEAFVDPSFTVDDPTYASLYHFEGIPSIAPSVPEPASWALAMVGLGLMWSVRAKHLVHVVRHHG
jgi:hypothetical protein